MSAADIEVVRAYNAAVLAAREAGDTEMAEARRYLADDVTMSVFPAMPYGGTHVGHDAVLNLLQAVVKTRVTIGETRYTLVDAGAGCVGARISFLAASPATGDRVQFEMLELYTIAGGKITSLVPFYWDSAEIVAALGTERLVDSDPRYGEACHHRLKEVPDSSNPHIDAVRSARDALAEVLAGSGSAAEAALGSLHPDFATHLPKSLPYGGARLGPAGLGELLMELRTTFSDLGESAVTYLAGGNALATHGGAQDGDDSVIVHAALRPTVAATGVQVPIELVEVWVLSDGRPAAVTTFHWDTIELARALAA